MPATISTRFHTIPVLYEDEDIIALEKPINLASIPERNPEKISLLKVLQEARGKKYHVVHRLDKQVSGVILFAGNADAHRFLNAQFEHRRVRKTYLALVHGEIAEDSGVIEIPLRRFGSGRMGEDRLRGKISTTEFTVIRRQPGYSLVEIRPVTGRKHQIRAHFFILGHPVVGDPLYGDRATQRSHPRLMLHALRIQLDLPSGKRADVRAEIPVAFFPFLDKI
jgi:RluA family pseudouridine synthase